MAKKNKYKLKHKINIYHAFDMLRTNGIIPDYIYLITDFMPSKLIQLKSIDANQNYYKYDTSAILLELRDGDNIITYWLCDNNYNIIGVLGSFDDASDLDNCILVTHPFK